MTAVAERKRLADEREARALSLRPEMPPQPLRALREARGLTQTELGRRAGVSGAHVCTLESGRQPAAWARLQRIADVCGVTTDAVLGRGDPPPAPVDAISSQDRKLLDALRRYAELYLGPQVLKLAGGWRRIAEVMWLGDLSRMRHHALAPGKPVTDPPTPREWWTGWESKLQRRWRLHR